MTTSHTPGPWHDVSDKVSQRYKSGQPQMALVSTPNSTQCIDCTRSGKTFAEDCANARLIHASPDLLKALEGLVKAVVRQTEAYGPALALALDAARAAIAKATTP